jgi:hypothetical protein
MELDALYLYPGMHIHAAMPVEAIAEVEKFVHNTQDDAFVLD